MADEDEEETRVADIVGQSMINEQTDSKYRAFPAECIPPAITSDLLNTDIVRIVSKETNNQEEIDLKQLKSDINKKLKMSPVVDCVTVVAKMESSMAIVETTNPVQAVPLPTEVQPAKSVATEAKARTVAESENTGDDSDDQIAELRTSKLVKSGTDKKSGVMHRSKSHTSRTTRSARAAQAFRAMFCCGVDNTAPSEDKITRPSRS